MAVIILVLLCAVLASIAVWLMGQLIEHFPPSPPPEPSPSGPRPPLPSSSLQRVPLDIPETHGVERGKPEAEIELLDCHDNIVGLATAALVPHIYSSGLVVEIEATFAMKNTMEITGFGLWIGNEYLKGAMDRRLLHEGDEAYLHFKIPVQIQAAVH